MCCGIVYVSLSISQKIILVVDFYDIIVSIISCISSLVCNIAAQYYGSLCYAEFLCYIAINQ